MWQHRIYTARRQRTKLLGAGKLGNLQVGAKQTRAQDIYVSATLLTGTTVVHVRVRPKRPRSAMLLRLYSFRASFQSPFSTHYECRCACRSAQRPNTTAQTPSLSFRHHPQEPSAFCLRSEPLPPIDAGCTYMPNSPACISSSSPYDRQPQC